MAPFHTFGRCWYAVQLAADRRTAAVAGTRCRANPIAPWGTPANSTVIFGAGAILFSLWENILVLAAVSTLARQLAYVVSITALPILRRRANLTTLNKTLMLAAPVALVLSLWAATQTTAIQWQMLGGFAGVGTGLYFLARRGEVQVSSTDR